MLIKHTTIFNALIIFPIKVLYFKYLHAMFLSSRTDYKNIYDYNSYNRMDRVYTNINLQFFKRKTMFWLLARTFYIPIKTGIYIYIIYLMLFSSLLGFALTVTLFFSFIYGSEMFNKWYAKNYMIDGFTNGRYTNQDTFFEFFGLYCFKQVEGIILHFDYPFLWHYFIRRDYMNNDCRKTFLGKQFLLHGRNFTESEKWWESNKKTNDIDKE